MSIKQPSSTSPSNGDPPRSTTLNTRGAVARDRENADFHEPALDPPALPNSSKTFLGRYTVADEIARGGMGIILRGHDPDLNRDLAIKVLREPSADPVLLRRFVEEARIGGQLQHPGIVPVYEIGSYGEQQPYFTMKLVEGRTLAQMLRERRDRAEDLPRLLGIFQQICQTMAYAHDRGVIHRDLKPGNIMVGSFGEVQVMDWGLATVLNKLDEDDSNSQAGIHTVRSEAADSLAGTVSGTPGYMSPEQAFGENACVDRRADVFALGSILCEIITGHPAYEACAGEDTYHRTLAGDLTLAHAYLHGCGADAPLIQLVQRCLETAPERRPADAGVLSRQLTAYLNGVQERLRQLELDHAATQARTLVETRSRRLKQTLAGLLALVLFAAAAAGWWFYERRALLRLEVERDLALAEESQRSGDWLGTRTAGERARGRLAGAGLTDLQQRLQRVDANVHMMEQLEDIRLRQADVTDGHFNRGPALLAYDSAFKQFDLDVLSLPPAEAARRLRESPLNDQLLAALDDWLLLLPDANRLEWQRLLDVVQQADGDEHRRPLRSAWAARDWPTLKRLSAPRNGSDLPPTTALFVAAALQRAEARSQAIEVLEAAQRQHPADFWLNHGLAYALHRLTDRQEEAVGYFRAALALRPNSTGVYLNLSVALDRLGRHGEAEAACRQALALDPTYAEAYTNIAFFLRRRGLLDEAEAPLQQALKLKPRLANAYLNLFYIRQQQGRLEEAEAALRQALECEPANADWHHQFGVFLREQRGQPSAAQAEFQKALALQPRNALYHFQVGHSYEGPGDRKRAEQEYRTALALDPKLAMAHMNLGSLLFEQGRYPEAEREHRAALAADPQLAIAALNLGATLGRQHRFDEAVAAYRRVIQLKPELALAYAGLGFVQYDQAQYAAAEKNFREALRRGHDTTPVRIQLGLALSNQGRYAEAEREYRAALNKDEKSALAQCCLGVAICEQGRLREGYELLQQGHERGREQPNWQLPSEQWLRHYDHLARLEVRLPEVLAKQTTPPEAAEWLEFANLCELKHRYADAVICYREAFTASPKLATDYRKGGGRSHAARAAVLAAAGSEDEAAQAEFRRQALTWLQADVNGWTTGTAAPGSTKLRAEVRQSLLALQQDDTLEVVRADASLKKLPVAEGRAFREFWQSVAALLQRLNELKD